MALINEAYLFQNLRRIIKEEIKKEVPNNQVDALWKFLNKLDERIKCLEEKKMNFDEEKMIDNYLDEGYDRKKDDESEQDDEFSVITSECESCGGLYEEDELDIVDGKMICCNCEAERQDNLMEDVERK